VPSFAALIPKLPECKSMAAQDMPWVKESQRFFETWEKVAPCMPKYEEFLLAHKAPKNDLGKGAINFENDLKKMGKAQAGRAMHPEAQAKLAEFYLAVALRMRPEEISEAGDNQKKLLQVAQTCAEEDFEPFLENARALISDYDATLHKALEDTSPFYEVDEGLFWQANFEVAAPAELHNYLTTLGHGSGQRWSVGELSYRKWLPEDASSSKDVSTLVDAAWRGFEGNDSMLDSARRAGKIAYEKWLQASSMPVKAAISNSLMEHGLLVSKEVQGNTPLPVVPSLWPSSTNAPA
jgi:hypothetical protein